MSNPSTKSRFLIRIFLGALVLGGGFALWRHFHLAHDHSAAHEHEAAGVTALALNDGKRWDTDQALRTGMQRIRDAAAPVLGARPPEVTQAAAAGLSAAIQENVTYLIQNCKLAPKADATLHVLITDFLRGAELLKNDPHSAEGATLIREALRQYPDYFDHPGWQPLPAAQP